MLMSYAPDTDVPVRITLADQAGAALTPAALRWRVLDETETVLQDWTLADVASASAGYVDLLVPGALNALGAGVIRAMRTVELEVVTAQQGTHVLTAEFVIRGATALTFGVTSFQTYAQAALLVEDMTESDAAGWNSASREKRERALAEAYRRVMQLPLHAEFEDGQSYLQPDEIFREYLQLRNMTPEQLLRMDSRFLTALRQAQAAEATDILNGDPVMEARKSGVMSMTVGESSQFFRPAKPLELACGPRAVNLLQRWIRIRAVVRRG